MNHLEGLRLIRFPVVPLKRVLERNDSGAWGVDSQTAGTAPVTVLRSTDQSIEGKWNIEAPAIRFLTTLEASATQLVEGDLVVTKSSGSERHIGKTTIVDAEIASDSPGFSNFMQRLRPKYQVLAPRFAWYFLNSPLAREQMVLASSTSTGLANLNARVIGELSIPLPSREEQSRIAAFLDYETARIDELVHEQEKLLQLLSEKQQAVMRHAIAKGVDPNARMRDSGVAWLGEIPKNWELVPLKHQCRFVGGGTPSKENPDYWQGEIPWVSAKDMKAFWLSQSVDSITEKAVFESSTNVVDPGALLIVVRSGILQRRIPVGINTIRTAINQDMKALIFDRPETAEYVGYLIQGNETALLRVWRKQGATVESIEQEHLANTLLPVPPVEEASKIVKELRRALNQYENLQLESQQAIRLLNERRSALISAAVTGQLDLRNWQPPKPVAMAEVA